MLIYCPKCEAASDVDAVACTLCGHPFVETTKKPPDPAPPVKAKSKARSLPTCRECEHAVARSAKVCPNCGAPRPSVSKKAQRVQVAISAACMLIVVVVCSGVFSTNAPREWQEPLEGEQTYTAYTKVQEFVELKLVSPGTANWPWLDWESSYLGDGRYRVVTHVDSHNGFGALIRSNVNAVVEYVGEKRWRLVSLSMN
jgi:RNA polymerase subunit RPABC4/transcription elongation factor Spt4